MRRLTRKLLPAGGKIIHIKAGTSRGMRPKENLKKIRQQVSVILVNLQCFEEGQNSPFMKYIPIRSFTA
jgi:hypothetical protein